MAKQRPIQFMSPKQARQLTELAERARLSLKRFSGTDLEYNAIGLQMLDEWIDRHVKQFPKPSKEVTMIWGAFLGETFRRRFNGEWAINKAGDVPRLGVICPRSERGLLFIDVMDQIQRRLREGMSESLAFYYTIKGVELQSG